MQTAVALLQQPHPLSIECSTEVSGSKGQDGPNQGGQQDIACGSPASSRDSASDSMEVPSDVDMIVYHPPRLAMKDEHAALVPPAERYSKWISQNVHYQKDHSLAALINPDKMHPIRELRPKHAMGMAGSSAKTGSAQACYSGPAGDKDTFCGVVVACSTIGSDRQAGEQTCFASDTADGQRQSLEDVQKLNSLAGEASFSHACFPPIHLSMQLHAQ